MLTCIENCKLIQAAQVFVDGFLDFSEFERRMLSSIAKVARQMDITLLLDTAAGASSGFAGGAEGAGATGSGRPLIGRTLLAW